MTQTATPEEKPMMISPLHLSRLRAARAARTEAQAAANEASEKLGQAREDRDDKKKTLSDAVEEMELAEEFDEHRLSELSRDVVRSEKKFVIFDRDKRSRADQARKMDERFVKVAEEIADGQTDMYSREVQAGDAWKDVLIADAVGDVWAQQFIKRDMHTFGELVARYEEIPTLIKSGDITKDTARYVQQQVARNLHSQGLGRVLPKSLRDLVEKKDAPMPDAKGEAKKKEGEEPDSEAPLAGESESE